MTDNDIQLGQEYAQQVSDDRQRAELGAEREHNAEQALRYFFDLIQEAEPLERGKRPALDHLRTLCYECGVPYERIIARSMAR